MSPHTVLGRPPFLINDIRSYFRHKRVQGTDVSQKWVSGLCVAHDESRVSKQQGWPSTDYDVLGSKRLGFCRYTMMEKAYSQLYSGSWSRLESKTRLMQLGERVRHVRALGASWDLQAYTILAGSFSTHSALVHYVALRVSQGERCIYRECITSACLLTNSSL